MKLSREIWNRAIMLEREFIRRGEEISRSKIQESLQVSQAEAQHIIFALDNKDIIKSNPDVFHAVDILSRLKTGVPCAVYYGHKDSALLIIRSQGTLGQTIMKYCMEKYFENCSTRYYNMYVFNHFRDMFLPCGILLP